MSTEKIIRAWKDAAFRQTLSSEEQASLPAHPAGLIDLRDADLEVVAGGLPCTNLTSYGTYTSLGWRCY